MLDARTRPADSPSLTALLDARQAFVVDRIPRFAWSTMGIAFALFAGAAMLQWSLGYQSAVPDSIARLANPTLGALIGTALVLLSQYLTWLFAMWSVLFVPYVAIRAHAAAKAVPMNVETNRARWIQLAAATMLPAFVFALVFGTGGGQNVVIAALPKTLVEALGVMVAALVTGIILAVINMQIPRHRVDVKLSVFSSMLYASLFLHYGQGIGLASQAVLLGILGYMMFGAEQIRDLVAGMATFDLDPSVIEKVDGLVARKQQLRSRVDQTSLRKEEIDVEARASQVEIEASKVAGQLAIENQLSLIKRTKLDLTAQSHQAMLSLFQRQLEDYRMVFEVYSQELDARIKHEREKRLSALKSEANALPANELAKQLREMMQNIHSDFDEVPQALEELHARMLQLTDRMEARTRALTESPRSPLPPAKE